ncbi:MAG: TonB-dependent receptor [Sphingomonas sp.]|uniref:TonB-dependent receptor n=1 Tax=Sphingomonas sp. TaxID=28214 RepID=UPI0017B0C2BB|nr:TonB-dependent receptor [Sphingomonas sp.]MBA3666730.1 TonB-dependent receptor [Sphingomonas sp.]
MIGLAMLLIAAEVSATTDPAEIIVTGRGLDRSASDETFDLVTLTRDDARREASGRLENLLKAVPGVQGFRRSDSRSSHPTSQSITMRGLGGNASSRALLILDGVPQADPFGGWVSFPAYSLYRIGSIRVARGGGSAIWGAGALAGTVELESATPDQLAPVEGSLMAGSRRSVEANASMLGSISRGFVTGSASFSRGDGFVPIVREDRGPIDRRASYRQASAVLRGVVEVASRTELQLNLSGFDDRRDRGVAKTDNRSRGADASVRLVGRGRAGWSLLGYVQQRRFASQFAAIDAARTTSTLTLDQYRVPATGWGARGEVSRAGPVELRAGLDLRGTEGETDEHYQFVAGSPTRNRIAGGRSMTVGAFADATVSRPAWTFNASARLDRWAIRDGRVEEALLSGTGLTETWFADRSGWQPTGRVAAAWRAGDGLTFRASAYRGWRLPTLNELYRPFRIGADATAANAALDPETAAGAEVGLAARLTPAIRLDLTAFSVRLEDAIANVTIAHGPGVFSGVGFVSAAGSYRRRENLDAIRSRGVEAALSATFGALSARLSYALADARVRDRTFADVDGLRPAQVPRHQLAASVDWTRADAIGAGVTARFVSGQFEDDANRRHLSGALTIDAFAMRRIDRHLALTFRGENLFGTRVEAALSERGETERANPRTLWIGVAFR